MSERVYPLPRPAEDARFTIGLILDVAGALEEHGYLSPAAHPGDLVELKLALFRFLYASDQ